MSISVIVITCLIAILMNNAMTVSIKIYNVHIYFLLIIILEMKIYKFSVLKYNN